MSRFSKILGICISIAFVLMGVWVLLDSRFSRFSQEVRVIFAVFLILYGAWKLTRYIFKNPDKDNS